MAISVPIVTSFKNDGITKATRSLEGFARKAGDLAKKAAIGVAAIGAGVAAGAWSAIQAASNIEESLSKIGVLFGTASQSVIDFSKTAATQFGLSQQAALDAAGTFGTFGKAAGLTGDDLSGFSTDLIGLAADLASFNNTSPEEAIEAIGAALRGESEPIRRYGVLLDDATLKARALELGIYSGTGTLDAQTKVLAAQAEIFAQTSAAQGDFARTSDGLANRQRILRAQFANVVAQIGQKLLPIALRLAEFFQNRVVPVIERVADAFSKDGLSGVIRLVVEEIRQAIPRIVGYLKEGARAFVEWVKPKIGPALQQLGEWLKALGQWVVDVAVPWMGAKIRELGDKFVDWVQPRIVPTLEALGRWLQGIGQWVVDVALPKLGEQVEPMAAKFAEWTGRVLPKVIAGLSKVIAGLAYWLATDGLPKLNKLGTDMALALLKGFAKGLKDSGVLKYLGISGLLIDRILGTSSTTTVYPNPTPPPITQTGGFSTTSLSPTATRGDTSTTYNITVQGAIDPVGTARTIRTVLTDDSRLTGRTSILTPVTP